MSTKRFKSYIAVVLLCVMSVTLTNLNVMISERKSKEEIIEVERNIVEEIKEKRTLTEKQFINDDGTTTVRKFNTPVHYEEDGVLKDIDSSLEKVESDGKNLYKTKANSLMVTLPGKITPQEPIVIDHGKGNKIYMSPGESPTEVCSTEEVKGLKDSFEVIETKPTMPDSNDIRTLIYDYNSDTKVSYSTTDFGIKEEFILSKYNGENVFVSNIKLEGFNLKLTDDNKIEVLNKETGEIEGIMPQPFVYDSCENRNSTYEAFYSIEEVDKDNYKIKVTVDKSFLESKNTTYPVYVDPTYTKRTSKQASTYVMSKGQYAGWNFYNGEKLSMPVGYLSSQGVTRTYGHIIYPDITKDVLISAKYWMYAKNDGTHYNSGDINLYRVDGSWQPDKITYNTQPKCGKFIDKVNFSSGKYG